MSRKKLTRKQQLDQWAKYDGKCWRCGIKIDTHKRGSWHWGHIIARSCGGTDEPENLAPECRHCNEKDAREVTTPMAAKIKRIATRHIGIKRDPQIRVSRKFDGTIRRWTKERGWEDVTP